MKPITKALIVLAQSETVGAFIDNSISLAWLEIVSDIKDGRVPCDVPTFAALHDYVDANEYGGLCNDFVVRVALQLMPPTNEEDAEVLDSDGFCNACNLIQSTLNQKLINRAEK